MNIMNVLMNCSTGDIPPVTGSWLLHTLTNCDAYPIMRYFWGRQSWCPCFYPKAFSLQTFLSAKRDTCYCSKGGQPGLVNLLTHKSSLVGGFNPSEKYESQLGWLFPIFGKIKIHVPNHQAVAVRLSNAPFLCQSNSFGSHMWTGPQKRDSLWLNLGKIHGSEFSTYMAWLSR